MFEIPYSSVPDMLRKSAGKYAGKLALKYRKQGKYVTLSFSEFYDRALMAARGLKKSGVVPGDRVAILSENRAGWLIADMGILAARGITVPVYPTNTPDQIAYMLNHSGVKIVFVSSRFQYAKLLAVREQIPGVELVVSFERFIGKSELPVCTFYQLSEVDDPITSAEKAELESGIDKITQDDTLTLIYTSGTTGVPKGVVLSHRNILFDTIYTSRKMDKELSGTEVLLSFLPLSHVLERTVGYYMSVLNGCLVAFADSIEKIPENMLEVKPSVIVSVPRLFEKIYSRIYENVHQSPVLKRKIFHWAVKVGMQYVEHRYISKKPSRTLSVKQRIAEILVFSKMRERFGGNMKFCCSGGAPLDKSISEFFWAIGLPIFEGYGLTETSPVLCTNSLEYVRFGSVGTPLEHTEFRIAADGEILVKGPQVMKGYYNNPEATAEAFEDGWFKTGDIGHIDNGFIYITDRKKEIIVTAGGKNVPPQPIENELKMDKYIASAFVFGDRKPYLTALIVPNLDRLLEYAREKHVDYYDLNDLIIHEPVQKLFEQRIAEINRKLPQYETIKKFVLLPRDFSIDEEELTATLKLRRKVIYEKHKEKIEGMYIENGN